MPKPPVPRLTVVTLGVADMRRSIALYQAVGFSRNVRATGEAVAFFDTGATVIRLFPWDQFAEDAALPDQPLPSRFSRHDAGMELPVCRGSRRGHRVCGLERGTAVEGCAQDRLRWLFPDTRSGRASLGSSGCAQYRSRGDRRVHLAD